MNVDVELAVVVDGSFEFVDVEDTAVVVVVVVVEVVVEKITCRMLCLGLRPKLPAIVEGGHRRREVEETSSYKWFWGPVKLSKPFEVSCPQAVKICSTHGGRRLTAVVRLTPSSR